MLLKIRKEFWLKNLVKLKIFIQLHKEQNKKQTISKSNLLLKELIYLQLEEIPELFK